MEVFFFFRKPTSYTYSIEKIFSGIIANLPNSFKGKRVVVPYWSQGIKPILNILAVFLNQGEINHVTGDIHYVTFGLRKNKTILTIHDLGFLNHPNAFLRKILELFWVVLPVRFSRYVTVISEATKKDLLSRITCREDKIIVIPDFVDPDFIPSLKVFNKSRPIILQVGTKKNKNVNNVIEAIKGLDCILYIIGKPNIELENLLKTYDIECQWFSKLNNTDLIKKYGEADLLVFVSLFEGFGMPIIEAQAIGRPVVTSNLSSMPEVAGNAACLVNPNSIDSIREGILKVINQDEYRDQLIIKGFENVKRFDVKEVTLQYCELYRRLLQK